jgi:hypothetical protein
VTVDIDGADRGIALALPSEGSQLLVQLRYFEGIVAIFV